MPTNSNSYETIDGKKYKKCKINQIRNPITNRCINIKVPKEKPVKVPKEKPIKVHKEKPVKNQIKQQSKKPNLFKKLFYPFINRVNANINDRIKYHDLLKQTLNINESKEDYCMRLYKYDDNGKPIYNIGNKIILDKQFGKDTIYSTIYVSTLRDKVNKIYKYMTKLVVVNNENKKEVKLLNIVTNAVLNHKCPHFPILYNAVKCNNFLNFATKTSFVKSNSNNNVSKKQIEDLNNYPLTISANKKKQFYFILNELATGDLKTFLEFYYNDSYLLLNAFVQIYLSLMFFYQETKHFHDDSHWGNFLYHKVKSGGYFHYKIFGKDYYLENLGFLWVIWDYGKAIECKKKSIEELVYVDNDFQYIINAFFNINDKKNAWLPLNYPLNNDFKIIIKKINQQLFIDTIKELSFQKQNKFHPHIITQWTNKYNFYYELPETYTDYKEFLLYSPKNINNIISFILNVFKENNVIKTAIKPNAKIINNNPYTIILFTK